jgi:hypothetical protein
MDNWDIIELEHRILDILYSGAWEQALKWLAILLIPFLSAFLGVIVSHRLSQKKDRQRIELSEVIEIYFSLQSLREELLDVIASALIDMRPMSVKTSTQRLAYLSNIHFKESFSDAMTIIQKSFSIYHTCQDIVRHKSGMQRNSIETQRLIHDLTEFYKAGDNIERIIVNKYFNMNGEIENISPELFLTYYNCRADEDVLIRVAAGDVS